MNVQRALSAAIVAAAATLPAAAASAAPSPKGVWLNDTGRGAIEIKSCGEALCGHVVWVKASGDEKGCGKQIIGEARPAGGGSWDNGWIYSPERKRRYDVELTPLSEQRLRVVGYAGTKFFSKTMIWTKAPDSLQRCGTKTTVEANAAPAPVAAPAVATAPPAAKSEPKPAATAASETKPATAASETKPATAASETKPATAASETKPAATAGKEAAKPAPKLPVTLLNAPALPQPEKVAAAPAKDPAKPAGQPDAAPAAAGPPSPDSASSDNAASETAAAADDDDPADAPKADGGGLNIDNLKLGDLDLDKVLQRTGDGKCKLNLPFIKVRFDCEK